MDVTLRELMVLAFMACFGLALAWGQQNDFFVAIFTAEVTFAVIAAYYG
jgi:hypothetical protein